MYEIASRMKIAGQARAAASVCVETKTHPANPYPVGGEAYQEYHRLYCYELVRQSAAREVAA